MRIFSLWLKSQKHLSQGNFCHLLTFFLRFRLSNGFFILLKNLRGECHKEVGAPKMGLNEARDLCPDAPGFFNLFPGIWTSDHPPQKILYPTPFKGQGYFITKTQRHQVIKVRLRNKTQHFCKCYDWCWVSLAPDPTSTPLTTQNVFVMLL